MTVIKFNYTYYFLTNKITCMTLTNYVLNYFLIAQIFTLKQFWFGFEESICGPWKAYVSSDETVPTKIFVRPFKRYYQISFKKVMVILEHRALASVMEWYFKVTYNARGDIANSHDAPKENENKSKLVWSEIAKSIVYWTTIIPVCNPICTVNLSENETEKSYPKVSLAAV